MRQKEVNIYDLVKGDLITRIKPSKPIPGMDGYGEEIRDRSYIGKPMIFLGIANGCIYVEKQPKEKEDESDSIFYSLFGLLESKGPINLPLDMWDEGWSYYVDPYNINELDKSSSKTFKKLSKSQLQKELNKALENEDYKLANKIQQELDKLS